MLAFGTDNTMVSIVMLSTRYVRTQDPCDGMTVLEDIVPIFPSPLV